MSATTTMVKYINMTLTETVTGSNRGGQPLRLSAGLAKLIVRASGESQVWITTHSQALAEAIRLGSEISPTRLERVEGETMVVGDFSN